MKKTEEELKTIFLLQKKQLNDQLSILEEDEKVKQYLKTQESLSKTESLLQLLNKIYYDEQSGVFFDNSDTKNHKICIDETTFIARAFLIASDKEEVRQITFENITAYLRIVSSKLTDNIIYSDDNFYIVTGFPYPIYENPKNNIIENNSSYTWIKLGRNRYFNYYKLNNNTQEIEIKSDISLDDLRQRFSFNENTSLREKEAFTCEETVLALNANKNNVKKLKR